MKAKAAILAFLLAVSLSAHSQEGWKQYASPRGGFTVLFPGTPKEEKNVVKTDLGKVDMYQYSVSGGANFYMTAFNDFPAGLKTDVDPLDATVVGVLRKLGGSPSDVRSISLGGYSGRAARADGSQFSVAARFFWVQQRLYQLLVVAPRGQLDEGGANQFLESFRLLSLPGVAAAPMAAPVPTPAPVPAPAPATATLRIVSQPTSVEVYLDDKRRGITSAEEGKLVLDDLAPGSHQLRLSLAGYKDWAQSVSVTAGQSSDIQAVMKVAGPGPFTAQDVLDMLRGEISPKRVATLVQQRGVDFPLNDEIEKQIRDAGGDADLLLAIARARK